MQIANPRVDLVFKKLFGVEENKDLLISLINAIVHEDDQVQEITLLNPYNAQNFLHEKSSILDIKAVGPTGKRFNIEIQITDEADYDKRALYYWAKLYAEQLQKGQGYHELCKAIGIHILNFLSIPHVDKYHNVFHIKEKETGFSHFKDFELHTIELKKFPGSLCHELADLARKIHTSLDMWVAFLTKYDLLPRKEQGPSDGLVTHEVRKALQVLDKLNFAPEELDAYEGHLKWLRAQESALLKVQRDSLEEGKALGIQEGKKEMVLSMLQHGFEIEVISRMSGYSQQEVEALKIHLHRR